MFDILSVINEASTEANAFEGHPAKDLSLEERILYLQGLSLVMNADSNIHNDEKEYLRILIKSFDIDESMLESVIDFAQNPDKDTIQAFFRSFRRRPIAQLFLFDALMMAYRDGELADKEKAVVDAIATQLEVLKGTYQDIFDLFCHITNKNWQESALYFSSHLLNPEHFKHLLDYYEVDFDELMAETEELRKTRIKQNLEKKLGLPDMQWIPCERQAGREITKDYIPPLITMFDHDIILPWLQAGIDRGEYKVVNEQIFSVSNDTGSEEKFAALDELGMQWQALGNYLVSLDGSKVSEQVVDGFLSACELDNDISGIWLIETLDDLCECLMDAHMGTPYSWGNDRWTEICETIGVIRSLRPLVVGSYGDGYMLREEATQWKETRDYYESVLPLNEEPEARRRNAPTWIERTPDTMHDLRRDAVKFVVKYNPQLRLIR